MSGSGSESAYALPDGPLGLTGPVERPAAGTLPLRGDLAHIALAGSHLAAHYVIPQNARVKTERAEMLCQPREDAELNCVMERGFALEVLDIGTEWVWCCFGPDGPSGYVRSDCLDMASSEEG